MSQYKRRCYFRGKEAEKRFFALVGGRQGTAKEDRYHHIDGYMPNPMGGEWAVDVKSYRSSHKKGYVLVELLNTQGNAGWCHSEASCDVIAFEFNRGFVLVGKDKLRKFAVNKIRENTHVENDEVLRRNGISPQAGLYRLCGRATDTKGKPRKDVFTYIKTSDLKEIFDNYIPYE